jgi:hypothetical protein
MGKFFTVNPIIDEFDKRTLHLERSSPPAIVRFAADSPVEESGFEPLVPLRSQHNRGIGPISPIASIRVPLVMPRADSISISVASGASDSNPPSSSDSLERTWQLERIDAVGVTQGEIGFHLTSRLSGAGEPSRY